ncbi:hypothetical protein G1J88_11740 [Tenacibaculum dicentrarchi]|nr:hypothetical protein [Tenacibaculum dicentrarchi]
MKTEKTAEYFPNSFNMIIKNHSMLMTNQIILSTILSKMKDTDYKDELNKIQEINKQHERIIRENLK